MVSCGKCGPLCNLALGAASECGHACPSQGYKWCEKCARSRKVCQRCGKPVPPKKDATKPRKRH